MALYEITFLTKEETDPGVRTLIEEHGGAITQESSLGRKRLAYPIKKETQAVYTTYVFDMDSPSLVEVNRRLSLNAQLLRFLIVKFDEPRPDKEVSKTVREAIAAAEKLDDTMEAPTAKKEKEVEPEMIEEAPAVEAEEAPEEVAPEPVEAPIETPAEEAPAPKKPRAKKEVPADAAEATEEDRLKALEDKLGEILKD